NQSVLRMIASRVFVARNCEVRKMPGESGRKTRRAPELVGALGGGGGPPYRSAIRGRRRRRTCATAGGALLEPVLRAVRREALARGSSAKMTPCGRTASVGCAGRRCVNRRRRLCGRHRAGPSG